MKKAMMLAVCAMVLSNTAFADTVFYCKADDKVASITEKDNVFTYTLFRENKPKPFLTIKKKRSDLGLDIHTTNGHDFSVSLVFLEGDINYQATTEKLKGETYGSYSVTRMGTDVGFGKCEPVTYVQKLTDPKMMADIKVID